MFEALRPILNEMRDDVSSVKRDIVTMMTTINNDPTEEVDDRLNEPQNTTIANLVAMKDDITEIVGNILQKVKQHNNESHFQLADVSDLTTSAAALLHTRLSSLNQSIKDDFSGVEREIGGISNRANMIHDKVEEHNNQITMELLRVEETLTREMFYNTDKICGGTWGWRQAGYLDMTDPNTNYPSGWNMTGYSKRTCGRANTGLGTCDSIFFPVSGGPYSQVCGRIRAYQWGQPEAFRAFNSGKKTTIDSAYFDGVAIMHGNPRQHIWTLVSGASENSTGHYKIICPCDTNIASPAIPQFVGESYFCESGYVYPGYRNESAVYVFHPNDTLWDGRDCHSTSTCCSFHNPPYFIKALRQTIADDLELRICHYGSDEDTAVELVDLYVK